MLNDALGGKPLGPYELRKILPRYKGVSSQRILDDQRKLGLTSEKLDHTKIDPDFEYVFRNLFKRVAHDFDIRYNEVQGRNITKKVTGFDVLKEDASRLYALFKEGGVTKHSGRKKIKDDLILLSILICSTKYPEIHKGLHKIVTRAQLKAAYELSIYLLDLKPNYVYFPFVTLDKHIWDFAKIEKLLKSFRMEIFYDPYLMPLISDISVESCFVQTMIKVYFDLVKSAIRPGKKISVDWSSLATHIYCFRNYEKKAKVKLLKTNKELCVIWGIPPRTLDRKLAYLKQL